MVGQVEIEVAKRMELLFGELLRVFLAQQVRPAGRRNKKRITREHRPRLIRVIGFRQQIRHVLRRMPRSMTRRHEHFAKRETVAILDFLGIEAVLSAAFTAGINLG